MPNKQEYWSHLYQNTICHKINFWSGLVQVYYQMMNSNTLSSTSKYLLYLSVSKHLGLRLEAKV